MAAIRPLHGLRYSESAGDLSSLIAPPYDVLSPAQRDSLAARDPHNVVHLTLPESKPDDRSKYVKYARSAAALSEWRRETILAPESTTAFYRYRQSFNIPGSDEKFTRSSLITLLHLEPFESGIVLPHERTFPKHKEDRLRILEATRAHLETIFGLFEDQEGETFRLLEDAPSTDTVFATGDDGVTHELAAITDLATVRSIQEALKDKKIWIADGHHRYETALAFRQALGEREGEVAEDYIPIALTSMSDPGLVLLPTHRIVKKHPQSKEWIVERLGGLFELRERPIETLIDEIAAKKLHGMRAFGLGFADGTGYLVTAKDEQALVDSMPPDESLALRLLDVSVLHHAIFESLLELKGVEGLVYTRDPREAIDSVKNGAAMVWMMNPPSVDDMKTIALGGERMPEKSTYYFPKIQSGLVLWSLNDF